MPQIEIHPYRLALREPLLTAHGLVQERRGFWIQLTDRADNGWGEVAPLPPFSEEYPAAEQALARMPRRFAMRPEEPFLSVAARLGLGAHANPAAFAGVELAWLDLRAQRQGCSIAALWTPRHQKRLPVNALIRSQDPEEAADEATAAVAEGYSTLKLKLGVTALEADLRRCAKVRERVGPQVRLRFDANGAWDLRTARQALVALAPLDPEYIEQPIASDLDALRGAPVPLAADEAVSSTAAARRLIASRAVSVLVLKPMLQGGLSAAWGIAAEAHAAGLAVTITSSLDTAVGVAGALHLATAFGGDRACGLGTLSLFGTSESTLMPQNGMLSLPSGCGLGVRPEALTWT